MVKTRSQMAKEEESNNGRVTRNSQKAKIKAHPHVSDTAGIRKSARQKPAAKKNQLVLESLQEVNKNEEHNGEPSQVKREKMPAQMYRSLFNIRNKGILVFCIMSFFFCQFSSCLLRHEFCYLSKCNTKQC
jgi:hypothetical protein